MFEKNKLFNFSLLSQGSYGKVYKAKCQGQTVCIKKVKVTDVKQLRKVIQGIACITKVQGPHVIRFLGFYCEQSSSPASSSSSSSSSLTSSSMTSLEDPMILGIDNLRVCHVTEYSDLGPLARWLNKQYCSGIFVPVSALNYIAVCVLKAVIWLHRRQVAHLNLTPWSVVLDVNGIPKLTNFTSAVNGKLWVRGVHGKLGYSTPPECFDKSTPYSAYSADVFSFAVLLFYMSVGRSPFVDEHEEKTMDTFETEAVIMARLQDSDHVIPYYLHLIPATHQSLITDVCRVDPTERPGRLDIEELSLYPLFHGTSLDPACSQPSPLVALK